MAALTDAPAALDAARIREDFPALDQQVHGRRLVYLDNAASAQTPRAVIDAVVAFYEKDRSNVHRGVHELSRRATENYEASRVKLGRFVNSAESSEIVWTRGATEAVNLVAASWGREHVQAGGEVMISALEHHSNIVPWQILCEETGAKLRVIPMNERGELLMDEFERMLSERTRIVAVNHVSNALGTVNPVAEIVRKTRRAGAVSLIDGAQAVPHMPVDVQALGCDFYAFSGHKMCGPTGIGALYARRELLERMKPYQSGGDMILSVSFEKTIYNDVPYKFEAGTPNIADAIGMGAAGRLPPSGRHGAHRGLRTIAAGLRPRKTRRSGRLAFHRRRREQGRRDLVRSRRHPSGRSGDDSRSPGGGRAHRPSLRRAGDAFLQGAGDRESVAGFL